jgi:hypothetical protein
METVVRKLKSCGWKHGKYGNNEFGNKILKVGAGIDCEFHAINFILGCK